MPGHIFENIIAALLFTDLPLPSFKYKLFEVRQMIVAWNQRMKYVFIPSWVPCLDDSIYIWNNKFTCIGWMFVPRKSHTKGNGYHIICCGESRIMYRWELVEG